MKNEFRASEENRNKEAAKKGETQEGEEESLKREEEEVVFKARNIEDRKE
jgi:hypothetical protein